MYHIRYLDTTTRVYLGPAVARIFSPARLVPASPSPTPTPTLEPTTLASLSYALGNMTTSTATLMCTATIGAWTPDEELQYAGTTTQAEARLKTTYVIQPRCMSQRHRSIPRATAHAFRVSEIPRGSASLLWYSASQSIHETQTPQVRATPRAGARESHSVITPRSACLCSWAGVDSLIHQRD